MMAPNVDPVSAAALAGLAGALAGLPLARAARRQLRSGRTPGWRTDVVAALTGGGLFSIVWVAVGFRPELVAYLLLACGCVVLGIVDVVEKRLPDAVVLPLTAAVLCLLVLAAALGGTWPAAGWAALGGLGLFGVYFLLAVISPAGIGMGDVKLAGVLGIATAYLGWRAWLICLVAGFLIGGAVSAIGLLTRRATLKGSLPYGPSMIAGAFLAIAVA